MLYLNHIFSLLNYASCILITIYFVKKRVYSHKQFIVNNFAIYKSMKTGHSFPFLIPPKKNEGRIYIGGVITLL